MYLCVPREGLGKRGGQGLEFEGKVVIDWANKCGLDPLCQFVPKCIPQQINVISTRNDF